MARKLKGTAIQAGTISVTQLDNSVSTVIQTGGGPKITAVQVTDASWVVLDDTAVDTAGGNIVITGTGFVSGCLVYIGQTPANSVGFVSSTQVRVNVPALTAGTYPVYLSNPDGGTAIRLPGVTASANPAWQTASALPEQYDGVAINLNLVATEATSYTLTSGSLPPGLSLNTSTGVITGTVTGVTVDTTYTFTVRATDAQLQDSPRTFTVTITVSDAYSKLTTLLLSGSAISANTVIRDSSTNNFNLTVSGDARASNFTPYGTGWSVYFDGTGDYLQVPYSAANDLGTGGNWTVELWVYMPSIPGDAMDLIGASNGGGNVPKWHISINMNSSFTYTANLVGFFTHIGGVNRWLTVAYTWTGGTWYHIAATYDSTNTTLYVNGQSVGSQAYNAASSSSGIRIGSDGEAYKYFTGYISNCRIVKGTALYTANFTPATTNLTSVANTSLLTCHVNSFRDASTNNFAITRNGDARVVSFNPFNITNTGVNGSAYFDGTDDRLVGPTSTILDLDGAINFTIEAWVYPTSYGSTADMSLHIVRKFTGAGGVGYAYGIQGGGANQGKISLYGAGGSISLTSTNQVPINTWSHICVVKNSTTFTHYLNGQPNGSVTTATTLTASTDNLLIADYGYAEKFKGYMSELRIVKGTAVYTSAFAPPTSPLTAINNTQLLTLQYDQPHNNHTFLDSSSNQFLITRSGNATQGTFSPFSPAGWSNYFSGPTPATSYFTLSSNVLSAVDVTTGLDTTYEFWVYPTSVTAVQANGHNESSIWSKGTIYAACIINSSGIIRHYTYTGAENYTSTPANSAPLNTWTHVAVVLTNNTVKIFINGQLSVTGTRYAAQLTGQAFKIGAGNVTGSYPSTFFGGYISNFRIVTSALYSANFSPATTSLTAVPNTSLLICQNNRFVDNSTNAFAITASGSPQVQAFSPFAATAVYSPAVHGGSAYFDGSGDYARIGSDITPLSFLNTAGAVATIEAWVYATSLRSGTQSYTHPCILGIGSTYMNFGVANGTPRFYWWNGSAGSILDSSITITANTWNHIAVVFSGTGSNNHKIFVNGALGGTGTFNNIGWASASGGNNVLVGREEANPATSDWPGYISGLRITNGSALYNSSFTPATTPFTSTANTICLLNFTDAAILDSTGRQVLETVADAKTSSVVTKFTGGSMYFDGNGDNLAAPTTPNLNMGTGDWTIECWVYILSRTLNYPLIFGNNNGSYAAGALALTNSNADSASYNDRFFLAAYDVATPTLVASSTNSLNTWYHLALVRNGTNLVMYRDGISVASRTITSSITFDWGKGGVRVGGGNWDAAQSYFNGYIQDLRITRGYARYTANFTAPTAPARVK